MVCYSWWLSGRYLWVVVVVVFVEVLVVVCGGGCEFGSESVLFFELAAKGDVLVGDVEVVVLLVCCFFW
jgi:hypothetical protein